MCRVSLVVTETVDAGLLGEGIVPSVRHAWKQLLLEERSAAQRRVIPSLATVYGCLVECEHVRKLSRLDKMHFIVNILRLTLFLYCMCLVYEHAFLSVQCLV